MFLVLPFSPLFFSFFASERSGACLVSCSAQCNFFVVVYYFISNLTTSLAKLFTHRIMHIRGLTFELFTLA